MVQKTEKITYAEMGAVILNRDSVKIAICEDNKNEAVLLSGLVKDCFERMEFRVQPEIFDSGEALAESGKLFDLLFIDCLLPGINGVDTAMLIRQNSPDAAIIYTTAYREYAVDGYRANALRYLLKPIEADELEEAIRAFLGMRCNSTVVTVLCDNREYYLNSSDILYFEVNKTGRGSLIRTFSDDYLTKTPLVSFEKEIRDKNFIRTSKQYIVNAKYITSREDNVLKLKNGERVEISRRRLKTFDSFFTEFLKRDT